MITHLKGIVHEVGQDHVVLDVGGIGYYIICSRLTLNQLAKDDDVCLMTELVIREDAHLLYGFKHDDERSMYRLVTAVPGVGSKVAMALLSEGTPQDIVQAIQNEDKAYFCRAEGVGPKLGARLVTELKNQTKKLAAFSLTVSGDPSTKSYRAPSPLIVDARIALSGLGYKPSDIDKAMDAIMAEKEAPTLEELIRLGLQYLARRP